MKSHKTLYEFLQEMRIRPRRYDLQVLGENIRRRWEELYPDEKPPKVEQKEFSGVYRVRTYPQPFWEVVAEEIQNYFPPDHKARQQHRPRHGGRGGGGYNRRPNNYGNQRRPYQGNQGGGGYQNRPRYGDGGGGGGYQNRPRYGDGGGGGGYQNRPRHGEGGGGYQNRPRYNDGDQSKPPYPPRRDHTDEPPKKKRKRIIRKQDSDTPPSSKED